MEVSIVLKIFRFEDQYFFFLVTNFPPERKATYVLQFESPKNGCLYYIIEN